MELNILESEADEKHSSRNAAGNETRKVKGNWRAKRRAVLVTRPKKPRCPREKRRGRTEQITSDEFSSGFKAVHDPIDDESDHQEQKNLASSRIKDDVEQSKQDKPPRKKRRTDDGVIAENEAKENYDTFTPRVSTPRAIGLPTGNSKSRNLQSSGKPRTLGTNAATQQLVDAAFNIFEGPEPPSVSSDLDMTPKTHHTDRVGNEGSRLPSTEGPNLFGDMSFDDLGLYKSVTHHVEHRLGIKRPTTVQQQMLEKVLSATSSVDVLVRSETGSGKTLAYCLPIAHFLLNRPKRLSREEGSIAIIVVPTRELAEQVENVAATLFRPWHWIVVGSVRGGENKKHEKDRLRKGVTVLVATPGRLVDHFRNTRRFIYASCEFFVLDEADRLLDLGFEQDIRECIKTLNSGQCSIQQGPIRSNFLLSATFNKDVQELADLSLREPIEVYSQSSVSSALEEGSSATPVAAPWSLRQHFCEVQQKFRLVTLLAFLRLRGLIGVQQQRKEDTACAVGQGGSPDESGLPACKIIVFFSTCDSVDFHHALFSEFQSPRKLLYSNGSKAGSKMIPLSIMRIHGMRSQSERVDALRQFRHARRAVLLCTDVAARGLDFQDVTFSVQYDPPTGGTGEELEYLHRAGRTARLGEKGDALLFLLPSEKPYVKYLERTGASMTEISSDTGLAALLPGFAVKDRQVLVRNAGLATSILQEALECFVQENREIASLAQKAFQAHCRAYATHARDFKHLFHVKNLHLGHVARTFAIVDSPAGLSSHIASKKSARKGSQHNLENALRKSGQVSKGDIVRAISEGVAQPFNDQSTTLARRRREGGRGEESFKELASEFGS